MSQFLGCKGDVSPVASVATGVSASATAGGGISRANMLRRTFLTKVPTCGGKMTSEMLLVRLQYAAAVTSYNSVTAILLCTGSNGLAAGELPTRTSRPLGERRNAASFMIRSNTRSTVT